MALHDDATLNIGNGHLYLAPVGTVYPTDPSDPATPWVNVGHTDASAILTITSTGGDVTTLATLQAKTLRTSTSPRVTTYGLTLMQFDEASLKLYYGSNATIATTGDPGAGLLGVPDDPTPTASAFLFVVFDGATPFGWYGPKSEVIGGDDIALADATALSGLPVKITPLNYVGATVKTYVIPIATI